MKTVEPQDHNAGASHCPFGRGSAAEASKNRLSAVSIDAPFPGESPPGEFGNEIPGPRTLFARLVAMLEMKLSMAKFFQKCRGKWGGLSVVRCLTSELYFASDPDYVREVMVTKGAFFGRPMPIVSMLKRVAGSGLLASEGEEWTKQRQLVQSSLQLDQLAKYARVAATCTSDMIRSWQSRQTVNLSSDILKLAHTIDCKVVCGHAPDDLSPTLCDDVEILVSMFENHRQRGEDAQARLRAVFVKQIQEKRAAGCTGEDFLSKILSSVDSSGCGITDAQAQDECLSMLAAAFDTVSSTLIWSLFHIAGRPDVQQRIREEVFKVAEGRSPVLEDLPNLTYTSMVANEIMRLYPAAWLLSRECLADVEIGRYTIKKGGIVMVSPFVLHRDPNNFSDPNEFIPERFSDEYEGRARAQAFIPFGLGQRSCVGSRLAKIELSLAIALILQNFELGPVSSVPKIEYGSVLRPKGPVVVKITPTPRLTERATKPGHPCTRDLDLPCSMS